MLANDASVDEGASGEVVANVLIIRSCALRFCKQAEETIFDFFTLFTLLA
ncbi:MAG: hypothetical protein MI861_05175 [Pirellulales bacterium]|nr:hypothetical protein [Pirellulales bacterium]